VHGRPIDDRRVRYALGVAIVVGLLVLCSAIRDVQSLLPNVPVWGTVLLAGTGGWLTAVGGAWKDAPVEGFSGWKFLRSPVVATGWAAALSPFTHDWVILAVAAGGWSVISIETYKTFLTGGRPPGKFAEKPVRFDVRDVREACRVVHVGLYGVLAAGLGTGLLPGSPLGAVAWRLDHGVVVVAVSLLAAGAGLLVLVQAGDRAEAVVPELVR
jgi:hypothetical protein